MTRPLTPIYFHYDLMSWFSDLVFYFGTPMVYEHTSFLRSMFECDKTFDLKVAIGHSVLISWFSDFALYLDTVGICSYFFRLSMSMTRPLNLNFL